jgi:hypothetical protein
LHLPLRQEILRNIDASARRPDRWLRLFGRCVTLWNCAACGCHIRSSGRGQLTTIARRYDEPDNAQQDHHYAGNAKPNGWRSPLARGLVGEIVFGRLATGGS